MKIGEAATMLGEPEPRQLIQKLFTEARSGVTTRPIMEGMSYAPEKMPCLPLPCAIVMGQGVDCQRLSKANHLRLHRDAICGHDKTISEGEHGGIGVALRKQ